MTALRRKTTIRGAPMKGLDLTVMCDVCNSSRAHGNHAKCSIQRKAHYDKIKGRSHE